MRTTLEYIGLKPQKYRTRHLTAGDTITCSERDAKVWLSTKRFRRAGPRVELPPPPPELLSKFDGDGDGKPGGSIAPAQTDDLKALRAEYFAKIGKRPFPGWGADVLRAKIAAA